MSTGPPEEQQEGGCGEENLEEPAVEPQLLSFRWEVKHLLRKLKLGGRTWG